MREQNYGSASTQHEQPTGWFNWAKRHPGIVLLGLLAMAFLALQPSPGSEEVEDDTSGEVALFI